MQHEFERRPPSESVDLMPIIQDERLEALLQQLEEGQYERDESLQADLHTIRHLIGRQNFGKRTELKALGWKVDPGGETEPELSVIDSAVARLWDVNVFEEPGYRVMFEVEVPPTDLGQQPGQYLVPPSGILACVVHPDTEMMIDIVTQLSDLTDRSYEIITSLDYQQASRGERTVMLNSLCDDVERCLRGFRDERLVVSIDCRRAYWTNQSTPNIDWQQLRQLERAETDNHVVAAGQFVNVLMPELTSSNLSEMNFPNDFPISQGTPLIELYSSARDGSYFVPISNVIDFSLREQRG